MVNSNQPPRSPAHPAGDAGTRKLEVLVSRVLFWGGLLSILVVCAGFGLHLLSGAAEGNLKVASEVTTRSSAPSGGHAPGVFVSGAEIIQGLRRRPIDPLAIIALGLVMLLATPILAVALTVPGFAAIRDYRYLVISLLILGLLAAGLLVGA